MKHIMCFKTKAFVMALKNIRNGRPSHSFM
ncbi:UNVERIFIED_CONTAM: hypothetical protein GTU68_060261 [Idotea baltica]|nr:hypothetical protein [Idotea baltica]